MLAKEIERMDETEKAKRKKAKGKKAQDIEAETQLAEVHQEREAIAAIVVEILTLRKRMLFAISIFKMKEATETQSEVDRLAEVLAKLRHKYELYLDLVCETKLQREELVQTTLGQSGVKRSIFNWPFFQMVIRKCMNKSVIHQIKIKAYKYSKEKK